MNSNNMIILNRAVFSENAVKVFFDIRGDIGVYFKERFFSIEFNELEKISESIIMIPVVANLLPFAWLFDCTIVVPVLDDCFYNSISKIKQGYIDMLPNLDLRRGDLDVEKRETNLYVPDGSPLALFSGGADAWCTLIRHIDERPHIVSVWGADIGCENTSAWSCVDSYSRQVAQQLDIEYSYIKSNFRRLFDDRKINQFLNKISCGYEWWHDLQHGIGLISLTVPLAFIMKSPCTYIASSFYSGDKGSYTCASDPTIDNMFSAVSMRACHDGYDLTRQDKIDSIVKYTRSTGKKVDLRVCFHSSDGTNCSSCEKCGRTILSIIAAGGDPKKFGFDNSYIKMRILSFNMRYFYLMKYAHYRHIQRAAQEHSDYVPSYFSWIFSPDLKKICDNYFKRSFNSFYRILANLYHRIIDHDAL